MPRVGDDPLAAVAEFEQICGLPAGFYWSLLREDDWSFVIKLHALIDATVTHLLSGVIGKPELLNTFARLELSNTATGKLAFAKALDCLDGSDRRFIRTLSEIRNDLVHDVTNAGIELKQYVNSLDSNQFRNFRLAFEPGRDPCQIGDISVPEAQFVRENPKLAMWLAGTFVIALAYLRREEAELQVRQIELQAVERYFGNPDGGA